jgi:hypothetical protein
MKDISRRKHWNFADWWALDASETGHGANLFNPTSTASLRGQFLDINWGKYGPGSDPRKHPSMRQQIISMGRYIAERYGTPTKAWAFHQAHNYYQRGGIVEKLQRGGVVQALQKGGKVSRLTEAADAAKGLSPAKIGHARVMADRIWNAAKPLFRTNAHRPPIELGNVGNAYALHIGAVGRQGKIVIGPKMLHALGNPKGGSHNYALHSLLHEMAHARQDAGLPTWKTEGGAEAFAWSRAPQVMHRAGIAYGPSQPSYRGFVNRVINEMPKVWWKGGADPKKTQFRQRGGIVEKLQRGGVVGQPFDPKLMRGARSAAPRSAGGTAPRTIGRIIQVANQVARMHLPYNLGGGHTQPATLPSSGVDCSAAVSYLLQHSGFDKPTAVSGAMASWFNAGPGKDFTIWANSGHVFTQIRDKMWGTNTGDGGPGWHQRSTAGFTARHPILAQVASGAAAPGVGTGANTPKLSPRQRKRLRQLKAKIKKLGLSGKLQGLLDQLTGDNERFAELADHAGQLSDDTVQAVLQGKDQAGWLQDELTTLFRLRNALIRAHEAISKARARIADMLKGAQGKALSPEERKHTQAELTAELKKPRRRQDHARIAHLRAKLAGPGLGKQLVTALTGRDSALASQGSDISSSLTDVQGVSAAHGDTPTPSVTPQQAVGAFGGQIFDVAKSLIDLGSNKAVTDTGAGTETADLLRQLLGEERQRRIVAEAQVPVFKDLLGLPPFGGSFATGGTVDAPPGAARTITTHGPETIRTPQQEAALGSGDVHLLVEDGAVDASRIRVISREEFERRSKRAMSFARRSSSGARSG